MFIIYIGIIISFCNSWLFFLLAFFLSPLCSLRLFQKFDTFRILVCGGDGSVGWVLSEIDSLNLHKQVPAPRAWLDEGMI